MKVRLLHPEVDFDLEDPEPAGSADLVADLGLDTVVDAMAGGDRLVASVCRLVLLGGGLGCGAGPGAGSGPAGATAAVAHRQAVLCDLLATPQLAEELYRVGNEAIAKERAERFGIISHSPTSQLGRAVRVLDSLQGSLADLRGIADRYAGEVSSPGMTSFLSEVTEELTDEYLAEVAGHLGELRFPDGVQVTARLGTADVGTEYVLTPARRSVGLLNRLAGRGAPSYTVTVADRDEAGARIVGELRDRAIAEVASSAVDAVEALLDRFDLLRTEVAWYLGCTRLHARLAGLGLAVAIPEGVEPSELALGFEGLYDVGLALHLGKAVVGNDLDADGAELVVVTGANQGGKSTFLRSVGLALSMLRAGTFVGAERLRASVPTAVLTHYRREEEAGLELGKLDEELARMATIADAATPGALLVSNESFAATNEREGSEIAEGVVSALGDSGVRVVMVTHLTELARRLHQRGRPSTVTLRAERLSDGRRTFRLVEAAPEATSYGADLWERIFGAEDLDSNQEPTGTGDRDVTTDTSNATTRRAGPR